MPHLVYDDLRLDHLYPSIVAPEDDRLDDLANDDCDQTYQAGLRAADIIRRSMRIAGRRRRIAEAAPSAAPPAPQAAPPAAPPAPRRHKNEQLKDTKNGASKLGINSLDYRNCTNKLKPNALLPRTSAAPSSTLCRRRSVKESDPGSSSEAFDTVVDQRSLSRSRSCSAIATYLEQLLYAVIRKLKIPSCPLT